MTREAIARAMAPELWAKIDKWSADDDWNGATALNARQASLKEADTFARALAKQGYEVVKIERGQRACHHPKPDLLWDHKSCNVCGMFGTDSQWGIASHKWFKNRDEAKFYQTHGRYPEAVPCDAPRSRHSYGDPRSRPGRGCIDVGHVAGDCVDWRMNLSLRRND